MGERQRNAARKEDRLLERLSDGTDHAWHADSFFSESLGDDDLPWSVRPNDIMSSPAMLQRIVEAYAQSRKVDKKKRKNMKHKKEKREKKEKKKLKKNKTKEKQ